MASGRVTRMMCLIVHKSARKNSKLDPKPSRIAGGWRQRRAVPLEGRAQTGHPVRLPAAPVVVRSSPRREPWSEGSSQVKKCANVEAFEMQLL